MPRWSGWKKTRKSTRRASKLERDMVSSPDHLRSDHGGRAHVDILPHTRCTESQEFADDRRADARLVIITYSEL